MPTVFVYEYCCATGAGDESLVAEGRAMRDAVADDFRRLPDTDVIVLDGLTPGIEEATTRAATAKSDAVLVIAPEFDDLLVTRLGWVGDKSVQPDATAVRLTADKLALADRWRTAGVPTPFTRAATLWPAGRLPVVVKDRFGAGSRYVLLRKTEAEWEHEQGYVADDFPYETIAQDFVPGVAASVALLVGPKQTVALPPTIQRLSDDGRFTYLGGELPIRPDLASRAVALGRRAVECVPGLRGYVGVDLVLGDAADGSADFAIEINPRLTTSYVGLRALAESNLAGAMLDVCAGRPVELRWKPGRVSFTPAGAVDHDPTPGAVFG